MQSVLTKCVVGFEEIWSRHEVACPLPSAGCRRERANRVGCSSSSALDVLETHNNQLKILTLFIIKIEHEFTEITQLQKLENTIAKIRKYKDYPRRIVASITNFKTKLGEWCLRDPIWRSPGRLRWRWPSSAVSRRPSVPAVLRLILHGSTTPLLCSGVTYLQSSMVALFLPAAMAPSPPAAAQLERLMETRMWGCVESQSVKSRRRMRWEWD
jgi:hypothetical protein